MHTRVGIGVLQELSIGVMVVILYQTPNIHLNLPLKQNFVHF